MDQNLFLALLFLNLITTAILLLRSPEGRRGSSRAGAVEPEVRPDFAPVLFLAMLGEINERLTRVETELNRRVDPAEQGPRAEDDPTRVRDWECD